MNLCFLSCAKGWAPDSPVLHSCGHEYYLQGYCLPRSSAPVKLLIENAWLHCIFKWGWLILWWKTKQWFRINFAVFLSLWGVWSTHSDALLSLLHKHQSDRIHTRDLASMTNHGMEGLETDSLCCFVIMGMTLPCCVSHSDALSAVGLKAVFRICSTSWSRTCTLASF